MVLEFDIYKNNARLGCMSKTDSDDIPKATEGSVSQRGILTDNSSKDSQKNSTNHAEKTEAEELSPVAEEIGGPKGLEPTRYGDWDVNGKCSDF